MALKKDGTRRKITKNRQQRQKEIRTRLANEKKLKELAKLRRGKKITTRKKVDGKIVTKTYYSGGNKISNIGKDADYGQRASKLKQSLGGIGSMSDYKKTEKKAFKEAEKFKKKQAKEKLKIKKNKENKNSTRSSSSSSGKGVNARFIKYKGKMLRRGTPMVREAEKREAARKRLGAKGYMRK